jgi:hypothetical protein
MELRFHRKGLFELIAEVICRQEKSLKVAAVKRKEKKRHMMNFNQSTKP